jgi:hypothetical protein
MRRLLGISTLLLAAASGCATNAPAPTAAVEVAPRKPRPVVGLVDVKLSRLLDFESDADLTFVRDRMTSTAQRDATTAGEGKASLRVVSGQQGVKLKLATLLTGRQFPGSWTLVGLQARSPGGDAVLRLSLCDASGKTLTSRAIPINADNWDWAWLDLTGVAAQAVDGLELRASIESGSRGTLLVDTVALGDNARTFPPIDGSPVKVSLKGLHWTVQLQDASLQIASPESGADGYLRQSFDPYRCIFTTRAGAALVIESRGRIYEGGTCKPATTNGPWDAIAAQHARPGRIEIDEAFGRVERTSSGDRDNDGYDESRGSYRVAVHGSRARLTLSPDGPPLVEPLLEIRGMPPGDAVVTVEGRLVEKCVRLSDGTLLVEIPSTIGRPTTVDVRIDARSATAASPGQSLPSSASDVR